MIQEIWLDACVFDCSKENFWRKLKFDLGFVLLPSFCIGSAGSLIVCFAVGYSFRWFFRSTSKWKVDGLMVN